MTYGCALSSFSPSGINQMKYGSQHLRMQHRLHVLAGTERYDGLGRRGLFSLRQLPFSASIAAFTILASSPSDGSLPSSRAQ